MRVIIFIGMLALTLSQNILADDNEPFFPVIKMFSALSDFNTVGMKESVTNEFLLLEHGEIWDINVLASYAAPSNVQRKNYFSLISSKVRRNIAFINYWNKAKIKNGNSETVKAWLESVVVMKVDGIWKLQQMHSTRVKLKNVPKSVKFIERYTKT